MAIDTNEEQAPPAQERL